MHNFRHPAALTLAFVFVTLLAVVSVTRATPSDAALPGFDTREVSQ